MKRGKGTEEKSVQKIVLEALSHSCRRPATYTQHVFWGALVAANLRANCPAIQQSTKNPP